MPAFGQMTPPQPYLLARVRLSLRHPINRPLASAGLQCLEPLQKLQSVRPADRFGYPAAVAGGLRRCFGWSVLLPLEQPAGRGRWRCRGRSRGLQPPGGTVGLPTSRGGLLQVGRPSASRDLGPRANQTQHDSDGHTTMGTPPWAADESFSAREREREKGRSTEEAGRPPMCTHPEDACCPVIKRLCHAAEWDACRRRRRRRRRRCRASPARVARAGRGRAGPQPGQHLRRPVLQNRTPGYPHIARGRLGGGVAAAVAAAVGGYAVRWVCGCV